MADAAGVKGGIFDGARDDNQSAGGQQRLESVPFRSCASLILGRLYGEDAGLDRLT